MATTTTSPSFKYWCKQTSLYIQVSISFSFNLALHVKIRLLLKISSTKFQEIRHTYSHKERTKSFPSEFLIYCSFHSLSFSIPRSHLHLYSFLRRSLLLLFPFAHEPRAIYSFENHRLKIPLVIKRNR